MLAYGHMLLMEHAWLINHGSSICEIIYGPKVMEMEPYVIIIFFIWSVWMYIIWKSISVFTTRAARATSSRVGPSSHYPALDTILSIFLNVWPPVTCKITYLRFENKKCYDLDLSQRKKILSLSHDSTGETTLRDHVNAVFRNYNSRSRDRGQSNGQEALTHVTRALPACLVSR
jgi:hypothetical protein